MIDGAIWAGGILLLVYGSRWLEKRWPIATTPASEVRDDWLAAIVSLFVPFLLNPLTSVCAATLLSWTGAGWIHLPTEGWWYVLSMAVVVVTADLINYSVHRLQHAVPFLWAMHSFHHSASAITLITGARHLWMERVLFHSILPIMVILFEIPPSMVMIAGFIFLLPDGCAHLNVRIPMGRMITWINSPQWHRIHHSVQPEHHDKNFASLLPLWDIVFGTAWIPHRDEYPDTGLVPPVRVDIIDSFIWPLRHLRHRNI